MSNYWPNIECKTCTRKFKGYELSSCHDCGESVCRKCRKGRPIKPNDLGEYLLPICPRCYGR